MTLSATLKQELQNFFGAEVAFDLPLAPHTSIHIGGKADAVFWPQDESGLKEAILWSRAKEIPYFILGKGSNTLVRDLGFRGMVINLGSTFRRFGKFKENGNHVLVEAEGGVPTQQIIRWAALEGLSGLERLSGVPGTIGGNIYMNAGTYLGEIADLVHQIKIFDRTGKEQILARDKIKFEYRSSGLPSSSIIVWALLKLEKGEKEKVEKKIREVFEKRGLSQPIEYPNLGSVFKNLGKKKAWELIEEAGCKGVRVGGARISEKHANFIINEGSATAKDVEVLIRLVKDRVKQVCGVMLETEVKIIGEEL